MFVELNHVPVQGVTITCGSYMAPVSKPGSLISVCSCPAGADFSSAV
jgi:hypothetical protein